MKPEKTRVALAIPPSQGMVVPAAVDIVGVTQPTSTAPSPTSSSAAKKTTTRSGSGFPTRRVLDQHVEERAATPPFARLPRCVCDLLRGDGGVPRPARQRDPCSRCSLHVASRAAGDGGHGRPPLPRAIVTPLLDALHFAAASRTCGSSTSSSKSLFLRAPTTRASPTSPSARRRGGPSSIALSRHQRLRDAAPCGSPSRCGDGRLPAITMAPQRDNRFGTCSIEVLTNLDDAQASGWRSCRNRDAWTRTPNPRGLRSTCDRTGRSDGEGLTVRGMPIEEYLRTVAYKDRMPEFRAGLASHRSHRGLRPEDLRRRFGGTPCGG